MKRKKPVVGRERQTGRDRQPDRREKRKKPGERQTDKPGKERMRVCVYIYE